MHRQPGLGSKGLRALQESLSREGGPAGELEKSLPAGRAAGLIEGGGGPQPLANNTSVQQHVLCQAPECVAGTAWTGTKEGLREENQRPWLLALPIAPAPHSE